MVNMNQVKLVIWDLDETFWNGTLTEGEVKPIQRNINLVNELVDRGIMCSIVSKNDYEKAVAVLKQWEVNELFIFPQISWNPKGEMIANLIKLCKLRAENVLFLDDNISNLEEAKFYNRGIMVNTPDFLEKNILENPAFEGKKDKARKRLKNYKVLEERKKDEEFFSSNEDFLRASHIILDRRKNCIEEVDRIYELIQRTNQLNYTKKRISKGELIKLISDKTYQCEYIKVYDDYGDYGVVGFYAMKNNCLEHFLFSCRILGFSIENYLYNLLGCPNIHIEGETAVQLEKKDSDRIDWIKEGNQSQSQAEDASRLKVKSEKILMIGGCDLEQASTFLESEYEVKKEFSTVIDGREIRTSDTSQLVNTRILDDKVKEELCRELPFFNQKVTFNTSLYSNDYNIIVLSVVDDYIRGMYYHHSNDFYVGYGGYFDQDELLGRYPEEEFRYLKENFSFVGRQSIEQFNKNMEFIIRSISKDTKIFLINGIELDVSEWIGQDRCNRNIEMNHAVDKIVEKYSNVFLVDMRKIVTSKKMLTKKDNRHFNRQTYYLMAKEIARVCNENARGGRRKYHPLGSSNIFTEMQNAG